jgi:hypothetical protein
MRLAIATMLPLVALPVLYAENRETQDQRPTAVAAAGLGSALQLASSEPAAPDTTRVAVPEPFLAAPVTLAPPAPKPPAAIAVRAGDGSTVVRGKGTFRTWAPGSSWVANPCVVPGAPAGETLTVQNTDNGFTARCVNVEEQRAPAAGGPLQVVLDTSVFQLLADVAEAPVPLQVSW